MAIGSVCIVVLIIVAVVVHYKKSHRRYYIQIPKELKDPNTLLSEKLKSTLTYPSVLT